MIPPIMVAMVPMRPRKLGPSACMSRMSVLFGSPWEPVTPLTTLVTRTGWSASLSGNRMLSTRSPKSPQARKEGRFSRPSFSAYAKGDGQPAGSPVETRDAFTVHPPS
jgi:hypothetical protein